MKRTLAIFALLSLPVLAGEVSVIRLPDGGMIPDLALGEDGTLHAVFGRRGGGSGGNAFYARAERPGAAWGEAVRIDSQDGSCTLGMERGPRIALGKEGTIHALWQGRNAVCHSRSTDGGKTWSEARNLVDADVGIDSPAIAADGKGNVWAIWIDSRQGDDPKSPTSGTLFLARSEDDGATWSANYAARYPYEGRACACCSLEAGVNQAGRLLVAFRGALQGFRDVYLLEGDARGEGFQSLRVSEDNWRMNECPMDGPAVSLEKGSRKLLVAWRSRDEVYHAGSADGRRFSERAAPAVPGGERRYPGVAFGASGEYFFAWVEGGEVVWELRSRSGKVSRSGRESGLPGRTRFAVLAGPDGAFFLVY
ncbi:MAG: exo-alpha-sialidase [Planctomycetes bacterium]|nr:exo-alpha-sialidase [Planctomycetota bacterium]